MKNMTALILTVLMMTSYFAVVDFTELEEPTTPTHETSARAGADPSLVAISTPKETVCDLNGCRNTLEVGQATTFSAYIQNAGDTEADDLSYSVTVYLTDDLGNVGSVLQEWENLLAMCDDGDVCDFDSTDTPHPFGAGDYLGGGKLTLTKNGLPIEWTPSQGQYIIQIEVDSSSDADIANNVEQVYVEVVDWYDIEVDLSWDNYEGGDAKQVTSTDFFTLDVTATGSSTFNPRNVSIRLAISGDVDTAQVSLDGGNYDLLQNAGITVLEAGTAQTVRTFENESDPSDFTEASRAILDYETTWSVSGSITPSTSEDTARFTIEAELIGYAGYGQYDECVEVFDNSNEQEGENITTWNHFCEVDINNDDRPATDEDAISGSKETFHDIAISRIGVYQGYNADFTGLPSGFIGPDAGADLNVGASRLYAEVTHRGSDPMSSYNWDVEYTVTKDGAEVATGMVDDCIGAGAEGDYPHGPLGIGDGAQMSGFVCVELALTPGAYVFDLMLNMDNESSRQGEPAPWIGAYDVRMSNNDARMEANVVNNPPIITSFEMLNDGELVVGPETFLEISVAAFDVDDPSGAGLVFNYSSQHGPFEDCGGTAAEGGAICTVQVTDQFVGDLAIDVVVTDADGGVVSDSLLVEIWNDARATATTASDIEIAYSLQYRGLDAFTITTFEDMDITDTYINVVLDGFAGSYSAVAVVDYQPSTTRSSSDVLTQSLSVTVPNTLGATSMWYIGGNGLWTPMDDTAEDAGPTASTFSFEFPENSGMLPAGTIVLMGGELRGAMIPDAAVSGFSATALKSGAIGVTWDITGTQLPTDSIVIEICEGSADCETPFETTVADEDRAFTYGGASTTHGTTYHVSVAVCNNEGCSSEGTGSVVADKEVDGDVMATNLNIVQDGDNWVVTWDIEGSTADVAMWHVCYQRGESFTAAEMPSECPDSVMGADATTLSIAMPTAAGSFTYYFTAVPMDALGNMDAQGQMNSIDYFREADSGNQDDNNGTIGNTGDEASSSVPTWAWGAIGGVVVVAFVVGAFILSRGDGEGGNDKDWDY